MASPAVHAISFPKSGKTWTKIMLGHILARHAGWPLRQVLRRIERYPGADAPLPPPLPDLELGHGLHYRRTARTGRVPLWYYRGSRVHLLVRDPRDVLVSHYLFERFGRRLFCGTLEQFVRFRATGTDDDSPAAMYGLGPIIRTLNAWAAARPELAALMVTRYEDLRADPAGGLTRICAFLGIPADPTDIDQAVRFGSIDNMRRLEDSGQLADLGLAGSDRPEGRKVRQGRVGASAEVLPPHLRDWIDRTIDRELDPLFDCYKRVA